MAASKAKNTTAAAGKAAAPKPAAAAAAEQEKVAAVTPAGTEAAQTPAAQIDGEKKPAEALPAGTDGEKPQGAGEGGDNPVAGAEDVAQPAADQAVATGADDTASVPQAAEPAGEPQGDAVTLLAAEPGTGGTLTVDPSSEIPATLESRPSGWVITCLRRERGIWRAGRFWPPEPTPLPDDELTAEQFAQLRGEKLLHIERVG